MTRSLERGQWDGLLVHNQLQPSDTLLSTHTGDPAADNNNCENMMTTMLTMEEF